MPAWWFAPEVNKAFETDAHVLWLKDPENRAKVKMNQSISDDIEDLTILGGSNQIIYLGLQAGLVRIRKYEKYVSAQFYCDRVHVRTILWTIYEFLKTVFSPKTTVILENVYYNDTAELTLLDLFEKLRNDVPVLKEWEHHKDLKFDDELRAKVAKRLSERENKESK